LRPRYKRGARDGRLIGRGIAKGLPASLKMAPRMGATVRLLLKQHRFEALAVLLGGWALAVIAFGLPELAAAGLIEHGESAWVGRTFAVSSILPIVGGLLLGVPLVGRELEQGTIVLPWTMGTSRQRWLLARLLLTTALLVIAIGPLALATDRLEAAISSGSAAQGFADYGARGTLLLARTIAAFAIGALAGLVLGRQLPALIVGAAVAALALGIATTTVDGWLSSQQVYVPIDQLGLAHAGDRTTGAVVLQGADGRIISYPAAAALAPPDPSLPVGAPNDAWITANFTEVVPTIPGRLARPAMSLEAALDIGVAVAGSVAALVIAPVRRVV
jgi:hypothetical protein